MTRAIKLRFGVACALGALLIGSAVGRADESGGAGTAIAPVENTRTTMLGPVHLKVPANLGRTNDTPAKLADETTGVSVDVSELPPEALIEFSGAAFLEFLRSLGYRDVKYPESRLARTDQHTYVWAEASGVSGPQACSLLVLGNTAKAAIVTVCVAKDKIADALTTRTTVEAILASAAFGSSLENGP